MSALKVNGTFISEKVSRVRWIPEQYTTPSSFLTGSWESHSSSAIKLWRLTADSDFADDDGTASQSAQAHTADANLVPKCTDKLPFSGDNTGMAFIDSDHIVVSSSDGFASVLHLDRQSMQLRERSRYARLHQFGADGQSASAAACTALSAYEHNVCTVGEDGRLNLINVNNAGVLRSFADVDSCSLTAVAFVSPAEVFTGNRMGTIKMFDLRANTEAMDDDRQQQQQRPVATMLISCDDEKKPNAVTALAYHPTQRHILLAGSEEGSITVWDLRMMADAASYLTAHDTAITELAFHPTAPNRLFTAAEGGELFEWSHVVGGVATARSLNAPTTTTAEGLADTDQANPWLSGERIKNKISVSCEWELVCLGSVCNV